jgi:phosphatidylserine/phosphatidylglycerophosphate/cardiolipin synthase-like enzyme
MRTTTAGVCLATTLLAVLPLPAQQDFHSWVKNERAIMQSADAAFSLGPFQGRLPLGWIVETPAGADGDSLTLAYLGPRASLQETPPARAVLTLDQVAGTMAEENRAVWPSAFSGWETVALGGGLWGQRAWMPSETEGRQTLMLRIPATDAALTFEIDCAADAASSVSAGAHLPDYLETLVATLSYAGKGQPVSPPSAAGAGDGRSRAASRSPRMAVSAQALAGSPFHPYVARLRQALDEGSDPSDHNQAMLLETGDDALLARLHLIRAATRSIRIQTFIWSNDETGRLLLHELITAAGRGVQVQIICDHIASFRDVELAAFVSTVSTNLAFRHYRPAANRIDPAPLQEAIDFLIPNDTNQRMHNKLFVVDDAVAITGGRNIENTYYAQSSGVNFKDRDVLFTGPAVAYAVQSFEAYWTFEKTERTERLTDVHRVIRSGKFRRRATREDYEYGDWFDALLREADDAGTVQRRLVDLLKPVEKAIFLADPPGKETRAYTAWRRGTIARQLEAMMKSAQRSLFLQTPYLLLDGGMFTILKTLREQNPSIELLASSNSFGSMDNPLVYAAGFKLRRSYFKAGVDLYEYRHYPAVLRMQLPAYDALLKRGTQRLPDKGMTPKRPFLCIHAKGMVIDDTVAYVGSYNFDPRSISLNTEVGLLVHDPGFASLVKQSILADVQPENSWVIARREAPRSAEEVERKLPEEVTRARLDLWPFRHTAGYALKEGQSPQLPGTPPFYSNYEDVGPFPGADDEDLAFKKVVTYIGTLLSGLVVPLL